MASHILFHFLVIVTLVFMASADGEGGYKLLEYGEELSPHPWQKFVQRTRTPRIQRRQYDDMVFDYRFRSELNPNNTNEYKRKSSFEGTNENNNFLKESGVKLAYSRVPMPVILISSYPKP